MPAIDAGNQLAARMTAPGAWPVGAPSRFDAKASTPGEDSELRQRLGEFVGNIFYGTLFRQMHGSKLKGEYLHGGRGEDVFRAQLGMELAQRMGRAPGDPIAGRLYDSWMRQRLLAESEPTGERSQEATLPHSERGEP